MKQTTIDVITVVVAIAIAVLFTLSACGVGATAETVQPQESNLYAKTAVVIDVNPDENVVACEDHEGEVWEFYGTEDFKEGDILGLLMDDMGTETIFDDEIVEYNYNGTVKGFN